MQYCSSHCDTKAFVFKFHLSPRWQSAVSTYFSLPFPPNFRSSGCNNGIVRGINKISSISQTFLIVILLYSRFCNLFDLQRDLGSMTKNIRHHLEVPKIFYQQSQSKILQDQPMLYRIISPLGVKTKFNYFPQGKWMSCISQCPDHHNKTPRHDRTCHTRMHADFW